MGIRFSLLSVSVVALCACGQNAQFASQSSKATGDSTALTVEDQLDLLGSEIIDTDDGLSSLDQEDAGHKNDNKDHGGKDKKQCQQIELDDVDQVEIVHCGKEKQDHKVLVCHIPSGNPENAHEICISKRALKAHIGRHGDDNDKDYIGPCQ